MKKQVSARRIYHFDEVDSTQNVMRGLAEEKVPGGSVVFADVQTCGKGRFGRKWVSPRGGLWFSMVLYPEMKPDEAAKLTILIGVSVVEAVKEITGVDLRMKWPNDIMHEGPGGKASKVGGIIAESELDRKKIKYVIIGVGINVNNDISVEGADAVSLRKISHHKTEVQDVLKRILKKFDNYYQVFRAGGFEPIVEIYRKMSLLLGREVEVKIGETIVKGRVKGIDSGGALIIETAEGEKKLLAGEVSIINYQGKNP